MLKCPIISNDTLRKVDDILKSIKKNLRQDGLIKSNSKEKTRKFRGGNLALTTLVMYFVVILHQFFENPVKNIPHKRSNNSNSNKKN